MLCCVLFFFFFYDTATTEISTYLHTLSLHDALPISFGARVAGAGRCRPLSRLASAYGARKRPGRSEEAPLYPLAAGLDGPCDFGGGEGRSPQTTIRLRLARGDQRAAPDRGGVSSGEVAGRHPTQAPAVLLGLRLLARIFGDEAIFAASACQDREFAGAVRSAAHMSELQSLM